MTNSKFESEYMSLLSSFRSRIAASDRNDYNIVQKVKASNRVENSEKNRLNYVLQHWTDKKLVKKTLKDVIYTLNRQWDESKDGTLEQVIIALDEVSERIK